MGGYQSYASMGGHVGTKTGPPGYQNGGTRSGYGTTIAAPTKYAAPSMVRSSSIGGSMRIRSVAAPTRSYAAPTTSYAAPTTYSAPTTYGTTSMIGGYGGYGAGSFIGG